MRVIVGIDPGSYELGIAFLSEEGKLVYSEMIKSPANKSRIVRISYIKGKVRSLFRRAVLKREFGGEVKAVFYEEPHARNAKTAKVLSEVIGSIVSDIYENFKIEAKPIDAVKARKALGLGKKASKKDVKKKICELIGQDSLSQHEVDAILIALGGEKCS